MPGTLVHLPAGTTHWFRFGPGGGEMLSMTSREGASQMFTAFDRGISGHRADERGDARVLVSARDPQDLADAFAGWDAAIAGIIEQIGRTFPWGLYDREPLPRWTNGRLALLGDAAHPMLPHQGQGANQAIEDAVALATLLEEYCNDPTAALNVYQRVRQARTAPIQRLSRVSGANYDATRGRQGARDAWVEQQAACRAWVFDNDAEAEALAAAGWSGA